MITDKSLPLLQQLRPRAKLERPLRCMAVTIAVGMVCRDGVVIAADTQISSPGYYKYHESKVHVTEGGDYALGFGYAGAPGLYREAREAIMARFGNSERTPKAIFDCCHQTLLDDMALRYTPDLGLDMLIGFSSLRSDTRLLVFSGSEKSLHWEHGISCLGVGDSSLTRYLSAHLYEPGMSTEDGVKVAVYIVAKAKSYIDHCGGETVLCTLRDRKKLFWVQEEQVRAMESEILQREKAGLKAIIGL